MYLNKVTITGADDEVSHSELRRISKEFPFVEWGILFSAARTGTPRYPSDEWVASMPVMPLAAHLCGSYARDVLDGSGFCLPSHLYQRVQVNGWRPSPLFVELARLWRRLEFILQAKNEPSLKAAADEVRAIGRNYYAASVLLDPSGGRGIDAQAEWVAPPPGISVGYAGGINPDNVVDVIERLNAIPLEQSYWIDMESGVRIDDQFDLTQVVRVLELARPFVKARV
jgi:hypothetical protein